MGGFLIFVLCSCVGLGLFVFKYLADKKHRQAMQAFAASSGWSYQAHDLSLRHRWVGEPFGIGHSQEVTNVLVGTHAGDQLTAFDYTYTTGSGRSSETHHCAVVVVAMPSYLPSVQVTPETMLDRMVDATGVTHDIDLESEDFNRRFRVHGPDPKFASDVLTPATMQLLLGRPGFAFRICGTDVVSWSTGVLSPPDLLMRASTLEGVIAGVPEFVWHDYGGGATGGAA